MQVFIPENEDTRAWQDVVRRTASLARAAHDAEAAYAAETDPVLKLNRLEETLRCFAELQASYDGAMALTEKIAATLDNPQAATLMRAAILGCQGTIAAIASRLPLALNHQGQA
jgi:hypothetical protein